MNHDFRVFPMTLAKAYGISRLAVAQQLGVPTSDLRLLLRDPKYANRVRLAVMELVIERERLLVMKEELLREELRAWPGRGG